jgi:hypothetical protein
VNDELEMMWEGEVLASFKVQCWNLPGGTEKKHEKPESQ